MTEQYFGRDVGKLGYGNMRLPRIDGELDVKTINSMIDAFMEAGYSYYDTNYVYEASEKALGEYLVKRYPREQYLINTKLSLLTVDKAEDMQKRFDTSRQRLGLDYVDFYFLHALNSNMEKKADELDAWGFLNRLKEKGDAKHIGFSFHDTPEALDEILTKHPETELILLQLNYLDWESPKTQSRRLYETARKHNVPMTVMEPCKGGWLASEFSDSGKFLRAANPDVSVASWAFRFLAGLDGIMAILTGMSGLSEVKDNVLTFSDFKPLSEEELELVHKAVDIINATPSVPCTDCRYCVPHCPKKIRIPGALQIYNNFLSHKDLGVFQHTSYMMGLLGSKPQDCIKCGACEKVCPQNIEIPNYMAEMKDLLETEA